MKKIREFLKNESGATAVEYGLIVGVISVGLLAVLPALSTALQGEFTKITTQMP